MKGLIYMKYLKKNKRPIAILLTILMLTLTLAGCGDNSPENPPEVEFKGITEETAPLAGSDLKLIKEGDTYTVLGTLKKVGAESESSYFEFSIALVDKNGKHIAKIQQDTKDLPYFTDGSTAHFQVEITPESKSEVVVVEFLEIKEIAEIKESEAIEEPEEEFTYGAAYDMLVKWADKNWGVGTYVILSNDTSMRSGTAGFRFYEFEIGALQSEFLTVYVFQDGSVEYDTSDYYEDEEYFEDSSDDYMTPENMPTEWTTSDIGSITTPRNPVTIKGVTISDFKVIEYSGRYEVEATIVSERYFNSISVMFQTIFPDRDGNNDFRIINSVAIEDIKPNEPRTIEIWNVPKGSKMLPSNVWDY